MPGLQKKATTVEGHSTFLYLVITLWYIQLLYPTLCEEKQVIQPAGRVISNCLQWPGQETRLFDLHSPDYFGGTRGVVYHDPLWPIYSTDLSRGPGEKRRFSGTALLHAQVTPEDSRQEEWSTYRGKEQEVRGSSWPRTAALLYKSPAINALKIMIL